MRQIILNSLVDIIMDYNAIYCISFCINLILVIRLVCTTKFGYIWMSRFFINEQLKFNYVLFWMMLVLYIKFYDILTNWNLRPAIKLNVNRIVVPPIAWSKSTQLNFFMLCIFFNPLTVKNEISRPLRCSLP